MVGKNTYLEVSSSRLVEIKRVVTKAISVGKRGTRMTIVTTNNTQGAVALGGDVFHAVDCRLVYGGDDSLRPLKLMAASL